MIKYFTLILLLIFTILNAQEIELDLESLPKEELTNYQFNVSGFGHRGKFHTIEINKLLNQNFSNDHNKLKLIFIRENGTKTAKKYKYAELRKLKAFLLVKKVTNFLGDTVTVRDSEERGMPDFETVQKELNAVARKSITISNPKIKRKHVRKAFREGSLICIGGDPEKLWIYGIKKVIIKSY